MRQFIMGTIVLTAFLLCVAGLQAAESPGIDEIVNRANLAAYYGGEDGKAEVHMSITDSQGRKRKRTFVILRRDVTDGGPQKFFVYFKVSRVAI